MNPEQSRGMNEKVTDGARGMFEKATGFVLLFPAAWSCCLVLLLGHGFFWLGCLVDIEEDWRMRLMFGGGGSGRVGRRCRRSSRTRS